MHLRGPDSGHGHCDLRAGPWVPGHHEIDTTSQCCGGRTGCHSPSIRVSSGPGDARRGHGDFPHAGDRNGPWPRLCSGGARFTVSRRFLPPRFFPCCGLQHFTGVGWLGRACFLWRSAAGALRSGLPAPAPLGAGLAFFARAVPADLSDLLGRRSEFCWDCAWSPCHLMARAWFATCPLGTRLGGVFLLLALSRCVRHPGGELDARV